MPKEQNQSKCHAEADIDDLRFDEDVHGMRRNRVRDRMISRSRKARAKARGQANNSSKIAFTLSSTSDFSRRSISS